MSFSLVQNSGRQKIDYEGFTQFFYLKNSARGDFYKDIELKADKSNYQNLVFKEDFFPLCILPIVPGDQPRDAGLDTTAIYLDTHVYTPDVSTSSNGFIRLTRRIIGTGSKLPLVKWMNASVGYIFNKDAVIQISSKVSRKINVPRYSQISGTIYVYVAPQVTMNGEFQITENMFAKPSTPSSPQATVPAVEDLQTAFIKHVLKYTVIIYDDDISKQESVLPEWNSSVTVKEKDWSKDLVSFKIEVTKEKKKYDICFHLPILNNIVQGCDALPYSQNMSVAITQSRNDWFREVRSTLSSDMRSTIEKSYLYSDAKADSVIDLKNKMLKDVDIFFQEYIKLSNQLSKEENADKKKEINQKIELIAQQMEDKKLELQGNLDVIDAVLKRAKTLKASARDDTRGQSTTSSSSSFSSKDYSRSLRFGGGKRFKSKKIPKRRQSLLL